MKRFSRFLGIFLLVFLLTFGFAKIAGAYDDETTHPALTLEIIEFYNLLHPDRKLNPQERAWIIQGSIEEDTPPRWINHFYDPINKKGWTGENAGNISPEMVRMISKTLVSSERAVSAVQWINDRELQKRYSRYDGDRTWSRALGEYVKGNTREAYISLGHTLHLLEDMSVPDHTRNDTHAPLRDVTGDEGSPFEDYLTKWNLSTIKSLHIPQNLKREGKYPKRIGLVEGYLVEMAKYSNKYFFSKDTINDPKYRFPKILMERGDFSYGKDENNNWFPLTIVDTKTTRNGKINKIYSIKNKEEYYPILDSYFSRLSKKVVLNGAGIIELFFSKLDEERMAQEFPSHLVKYDFSFLESPAVSFLGELTKAKGTAEKLWSNVVRNSNRVMKFVESLIPGASDKREIVINLDKTRIKKDAGKQTKQNRIIKKKKTPEPIKTVQTYKIEPKFIEEPESETVENKIDEKELTRQKENNEENNKKNSKKNSKDKKPNNTNPKNLTDNTKNTNTKKEMKPVSIVAFGGPPPVAEPLPSVRITEIMYNVEGSDSGKEWIELMNLGGSSFDITKLKLFENNTNHFISGVGFSNMVEPNSYTVIANNVEKFKESNPDYDKRVFKSSFSLSNDGELIVIKKGASLLDQVLYSSSTGAYGDGNSLQLINGEWKAGAPTPGEENKILYTAPASTSTLSANNPPIAVISFSPSTVLVNEEISFSSASSTDADGNITLYKWDFGDGAKINLTGTEAKHTYSNPGDYTVTLKIFNDKNASGVATSSISVALPQTNGADHIVISEVQVGGDDAGDEFVELYNPTGSDVDVSNWSIQYISGSSGTISTSTISKKNFEASNSIPSKGFFLIARALNSEGADGYNGKKAPDVKHRTFSISGASAGGKIFIVDNQEKIESLDDENIVDFIDYSFSVPKKGESLERKAWKNNLCVPSISGAEEEFSGNACDSGVDSDDFLINNFPNPQNTKSFIEPRDRPSRPTKIDANSSIVVYNPDSLKMSFFWNDSIDFLNSKNGITYKIFEKSSSTQILFIESTSTAVSKKIDEIGKTYDFSLRAFDRDGLSSSAVKFSVDIPSFFTSGYLYKNPNASTTQYVFESYYNKYPFVNQLYSSGEDWRLIVFYKNSDAEKEEFLNITEADAIPNELLSKMMEVNFEGCNEAIQTSHFIIFPDSSAKCTPTGPYNGDFKFSNLEDKHFIISFASSTFSSKDYVSIAYYDLWPSATPRTFKLVAIDKKKYKFKNDIPQHKNPILDGNLKVIFNKQNSRIETSWGNATDEDTIDSRLVYEINFSPQDSIDSALWEDIGSKKSYKKIVVPKDIYTIAVRAKDEYGNVSDADTVKWQYATTTFYITQDKNNNWSDSFGRVQFSLNKPDSASFQSIVPMDDIQINIVVLKLWQDQAGILGPSTLRLGVYKDGGSDKPDFTNLLGEATISEAEDFSGGQDVAFSFPNKMALSKDKKYWLVLDVAGYSDSKGFFQNSWRNAVFSGADVYNTGGAGAGFAEGRTEDCSQCSFSGSYSIGPADWYMKLGLIK